MGNMLTNICPGFCTCQKGQDDADGERKYGYSSNDSPVNNQGSYTIDQASKES